MLDYKEVWNPEGQEEDDWVDYLEDKPSQDRVEKKRIADSEAKKLDD